MRTYLSIICLLAGLGSSIVSQAQGILGVASNRISGLPVTVNYGDTIQNLGIWVTNQGTVPVENLVVAVLGVTSQQPTPFPMGTLDLTLGTLAPGDSIYVPLNYFVVSPQNSNNGSNVMVIWPTAPGTQPGDMGSGAYDVDSPTEIEPTRTSDLQAWPNPCHDRLEIRGLGPGVHRLEFLDIHGKVCLQLSAVEPDFSTDLSALPAGLYLLRISDASGRNATTKKLLKY